jgi:hypothetical protein
VFCAQLLVYSLALTLSTRRQRFAATDLHEPRA